MLTEKTFWIVKTSPFFKRFAAARDHPLVARDDPVCPALDTCGAPPSGPTVCVAMLASSAHSSHDKAGPLNIASRQTSDRSVCGLNMFAMFAFAITGRISGPISIRYGPPDPPLIAVIAARAFM